MRHLRFLPRRSSTGTTDDPEVAVRPAQPSDADALARLATLDSGHVPTEPVLIAEVGEDIRAALSLRDGSAIADPFHSTDELLERLRECAEAH